MDEITLDVNFPSGMDCLARDRLSRLTTLYWRLSFAYRRHNVVKESFTAEEFNSYTNHIMRLTSETRHIWKFTAALQWAVITQDERETACPKHQDTP